ncbi:MAG: M23 family metallopeptidase [Azoarcus sp.]|jgi:murein DD-endopeptidase MepM/ murein hydrolase activator NlpD|nr:M23 family metallopeptidase [Azoarcus sp.]
MTSPLTEKRIGKFPSFKPKRHGILLLALSLLASPPAAAQHYAPGEYPFRIDEFRSPKNARFVAVNNTPGVMTVAFGVSGSNFSQDRDVPQAFVVEPNSSQEIVQVAQSNKLEPLRFAIRYSFQPGDAFMPPDERARYILPFKKGEAFLVVQGPGGSVGSRVTHNNDHSRYAFDFGVPEGTVVTAAREGLVIDVKDAFTEGRPDPSLSGKGNLVAIMHTDRSIGYYIHLAPRAALVEIGQWVYAGDPIAHSGNTGYTYGPHLHFDVRRAAVSENGDVVHMSVPVSFHRRDGMGEKIVIEEGILIKAAP